MAGPVLAAALVFLTPPPEGLTALLQDSKKLTEAARDAAFAALREAEAQGLVEIGVGAASATEIGRINILRATHLAMRRALAKLPKRPDHALVDGNQPPPLTCPVRCVVGGDGLSLALRSSPRCCVIGPCAGLIRAGPLMALRAMPATQPPHIGKRWQGSAPAPITGVVLARWTKPF